MGTMSRARVKSHGCRLQHVIVALQCHSCLDVVRSHVCQPPYSPHVVEAVVAEGPRHPDADGAHEQQQHHKDVKQDDEEGVAPGPQELVQAHHIDDLCRCIGEGLDVEYMEAGRMERREFVGTAAACMRLAHKSAHPEGGSASPGSLELPCLTPHPQ